MSALQNLQDIKNLADQAIEYLEQSQTTPLPSEPTEKWSVPQKVIANEAGYLNEPVLVECKNGDILCIYRAGTAHLSNGAKLMQRRSSDRGRTFGAPVTIQAVSGRDCRNHAVSVIHESGRIVMFNRTSNGSVTDKQWIRYSDDNGNSYIEREFTEISAYPNVLPFGRFVKTSNGYLQLFYANNLIVGLFSNDGGENWANPTIIFNPNPTWTTAQLTEPSLVALDEDRLVVVLRDNLDGGRYYYSKSAMGGAPGSWSAINSSTVARFTSTTPIAPLAAPANVILHGETIYTAWDCRAPFWKQFLIKIDKEQFWDFPSSAWTTGASNGLITTYGSRISSGTASGGEYGYVYQLSLAEGVLRVWYDSKTGNGNTETCILCSS